ncbi:TlpA family protein disulfide reductase [Candidatus Pacebacteria bacterium]|nr:TlpA family protein disulfide reductase [Candidatus Paceibacterota bacterium]
MNRSTSITLIIIIGIIVLVGWWVLSVQQQAKDASSAAARSLGGGTTTTAIYTDVEGTPIDLSIYNGQVRVVNSWASWCPFCVTELPDFEALAAEFASDDVVVIAINRSEPAALVESYLTSNGLLEDVIYVLDEADAFYDSIGGFSMPETVFYGADGEIVLHKRGFMSLDEMRTHTNTALNADE